MNRCGICYYEGFKKEHRIKCCLPKPFNICSRCLERVHDRAAFTRCPNCSILLVSEQVLRYTIWDALVDYLWIYKGHLLSVILTLISVAVPYLHLVIGMGVQFAQEHTWVNLFLYASGGLVGLDVLSALVIYFCLRKEYRDPYVMFKINVLHLIKIVVTLLLAIPKVSIPFFSEKVKAIVFVTLLTITFSLLTVYSLGFCLYCIIKWLRGREPDQDPYLSGTLYDLNRTSFGL